MKKIVREFSEVNEVYAWFGTFNLEHIPNTLSWREHDCRNEKLNPSIGYVEEQTTQEGKYVAIIIPGDSTPSIH